MYDEIARKEQEIEVIKRRNPGLQQGRGLQRG